MDAPATVVLAVAYASVSYVELRIEKPWPFTNEPVTLFSTGSD